MRRLSRPRLGQIALIAGALTPLAVAVVVVISLLSVPSVPDDVVPDSASGAYQVGDWRRGGAEDGYGAQRYFYFTSDNLTVEQTAKSVVDALRDRGWRLCRPIGRFATADFRSTTDLDGEYSLEIWASQSDGIAPPAAGSVADGAPLVTVAVDSKPDGRETPPSGPCRAL